MTAHVVLHTIACGKVRLGDKVVVSNVAASTGGTSAMLFEGEVLTVHQLLYGTDFKFLLLSNINQVG